jgi:hypothetical protein
MADDDEPTDGVWDEYAWERFLREQDKNTEKYFKLLEEYMDHPERDEIIADAMCWSVFEGAEGDDRFENFLGEHAEFLTDDEEEEFDSEFEEFTQSPVYSDTLRLHRWINRLLDRRADLRENTDAAVFATRSAVCGAKLAAALCGHETTELGMTIAYLKRALHAANDSLAALARLVDSGSLDRRRAAFGRRHVFAIRNAIVQHLGENRLKWRERHGGN